MNKLTIFTPTFNRAYTIDRLYKSLLNQSSHDFEWLVIDDGSTDSTKEYFSELLLRKQDFPIRYIYKENGGKQRAINDAAKMVESEYTFIVDSDDFLTEDAVEKVLEWINDPEIDEKFAGVSGIKANMKGQPLNGEPVFDGEFVDCTNLERLEYNLNADMAEVYKTEILRKYAFEVWPTERFLPEALVWDSIAQDGLKLRWHRDIIYLCNYQSDGLTKGSWKLLRDNPMGYALLFDHNACLSQTMKSKVKNAIQMDSCLILAGNIKHIRKCKNYLLGLLLMPAGYLLSLRRKTQFKKYIG